MNDSTIWRLQSDPPSAQLAPRSAESGSWAADVDLAKPRVAFQWTPVNGAPLSGGALEIAVRQPRTQAPTRPDVYARRNDLVLTYSADGRSVRPQVYFTATTIPGLPAEVLVLDLQVLIETDLLESSPQTAVRFHPPRNGEMLTTPDAHWVESTTPEIAWVCGSAPTDGPLRLGGGESSGPWVEQLLFDRERLEKGVIQRGRFRVAVAPASVESPGVRAQLQADLSAAPPPLSV